MCVCLYINLALHLFHVNRAKNHVIYAQPSLVSHSFMDKAACGTCRPPRPRERVSCFSCLLSLIGWMVNWLQNALHNLRAHSDWFKGMPGLNWNVPYQSIFSASKNVTSNSVNILLRNGTDLRGRGLFSGASVVYVKSSWLQMQRFRVRFPALPDFSEEWVWNQVHSASWVQLRSYLEEIVAAEV
jgi:hypothetical protein